MDIATILKQVKSPFSNEEIEKLIRTYTECNCDMNEFYRKINLSGEERENSYLNDLHNRLFSFSNRGKRFVDENDSWDIIASSEDTLRVPNRQKDREPIYRIYINAKGQDKAKIIEDYIRHCEDVGQVYKLKYSVTDGRKDEILILSYGEDLSKNIELIETITEGMNLGEPAELLGRYKDKIGIGEEYIQVPIYSYTQTRLGIIPIAMQKYFLDHKPQFEQYLDEEDKETVDFLLECFEEESQDLSEEIKELSEKTEKLSEEEKNKIESLKKNQFAYQNNIDFNIGNMYFSLCQSISKVMKAYMDEHSEIAIPEIIENYRMACEIFGISREGVFSKATENIIKQQEKTPLQQREDELASLEKEERTIAEAERLIDKQNANEGKNIGD